MSYSCVRRLYQTVYYLRVYIFCLSLACFFLVHQQTFCLVFQWRIVTLFIYGYFFFVLYICEVLLFVIYAVLLSCLFVVRFVLFIVDTVGLNTLEAFTSRLPLAFVLLICERFNIICPRAFMSFLNMSFFPLFICKMFI